MKSALFSGLIFLVSATASSQAATVAQSGAAFLFSEVPGLTSRDIPRLQVTLTEDITVPLIAPIGGRNADLIQFILPDVYSDGHADPGYAGEPDNFYRDPGTIRAELTLATSGQSIEPTEYNSWGVGTGSVGLNNPNGFLGTFDLPHQFTIYTGDVFTIKAGTVILGYYSPHMPDLTPTTFILADAWGNALSAPVTIIPETSTLSLLTVGLMVVRRRKRMSTASAPVLQRISESKLRS